MSYKMKIKLKKQLQYFALLSCVFLSSNLSLADDSTNKYLLEKIMADISKIKKEISLIDNKKIDKDSIQLGTCGSSTKVLMSGSGGRSTSTPIKFNHPFKNKPKIYISVSTADIINGSNIRFSVDSKNITKNGFDCVFNTWSDTKVYYIKSSWIAISNK